MFITKDGAYYRQFLPHYRSAVGIYHCRFSVNLANPGFRFTEDWMFATIEASILEDHRKECSIHAYVIMANHTHIVVQPLPKVSTPSAWCDCLEFYPLERIVGRIRGRSSRLVNQKIGRRGALWMREFHDRTIRNNRDLENSIDNLHHNPVRWKLVEHSEEYRWSSLRTIYSGEEKYQGWFDLP